MNNEGSGCVFGQGYCVRALPAGMPLTERNSMKSSDKVADGDRCSVVGGAHAGKAGIVRDVHASKTGHITITVEQSNGERFKTLAKNVVIRLHRRAKLKR